MSQSKPLWRFLEGDRKNKKAASHVLPFFLPLSVTQKWRKIGVSLLGAVISLLFSCAPIYVFFVFFKGAKFCEIVFLLFPLFSRNYDWLLPPPFFSQMMWCVVALKIIFFPRKRKKGGKDEVSELMFQSKLIWQNGCTIVLFNSFSPFVADTVWRA